MNVANTQQPDIPRDTPDIDQTSTDIKNRKVTPKSTVKLTCRRPVELSDETFFTWYKDDRELKDEIYATSTLTGYTRLLTIESIDPHRDYGLYECKATLINDRGGTKGRVLIKSILLSGPGRSFNQSRSDCMKLLPTELQERISTNKTTTAAISCIFI